MSSCPRLGSSQRVGILSARLGLEKMWPLYGPLLKFIV